MTVEACHTLRQVASALAAAHEKGIHRTESEVSGAARTKLRLLQAVRLILSFGPAGLVGWWVLGGGG